MKSLFSKIAVTGVIAICLNLAAQAQPFKASLSDTTKMEKMKMAKMDKDKMKMDKDKMKMDKEKMKMEKKKMAKDTGKMSKM
jgi:hypothetical protein